MLALELAPHEIARIGQAKAGVEAAAGLLDAQASVVVGTAEEQGGLAFAAGEDGDADAALAQVAEHTGGEIDAAAQEHAGYGRQGHGGDAGAPVADDEGAGVVFELDVAAVDEEGAHAVAPDDAFR